MEDIADDHITGYFSCTAVLNQWSSIGENTLTCESSIVADTDAEANYSLDVLCKHKCPQSWNSSEDW